MPRTPSVYLQRAVRILPFSIWVMTSSNPLHLNTWSNNQLREGAPSSTILSWVRKLRRRFFWEEIASMYIFLSLSRMFPKKFYAQLWISALKILAWISSWEECMWLPHPPRSTLCGKTESSGPSTLPSVWYHQGVFSHLPLKKENNLI